MNPFEKQGPYLAIWEIYNSTKTCADVTWKLQKRSGNTKGIHITEAYATCTRTHIKEIPKEVLKSPQYA
jgi:hypothetical protein